jgi:hypothetical protein
MKAGEPPKWKDKFESQHGIMAPLSRAIIYITGRPLGAEGATMNLQASKDEQP